MPGKSREQGHMTDMTRGDSLKMIVRFAIPLVGAAMLQQMFSLTDAMVLGIYSGDRGLAVLGVCTWPVWFQVSALTNFGQASCLLTAVRFGAKNEKSLQKAIGNVYGVSVWIGILMVLILQGGAQWLLTIQNTPEEIFADALGYLRIIFLGTIFLLIYNMLSSLLRAAGDSYTSFVAIVVSVIANIFLDILFVGGFGWGVAGAAGATTLSQAVSALICLVRIRSYPVFRVGVKRWKLDPGLMREYGGLCVPMMAQSAVIAFGGTYVQSQINQYGTIFAAGVSAAGKIFSLVETGATSLAAASASFVSQNVGAKQFDRIEKAVRQVCLLALALAAGTAALLLLFGDRMMGLYATKEAMIYGMGNLRVYSFGLLIMYPMYSLRQVIQALGNLRIPLLAAILQLVMRVITARFLPVLMGCAGIYYATPAAWAVTLILIGAMYPVQLKRCRQSMAGR